LRASDRPIRVVLHPERRRPRSGTEHVTLTLGRGILAIPHLLLLFVWSVGAVIVVPVNWFAVVATGRTPEILHAFCAALVRYNVQVWGYVACLADEYPRFDGAHGHYPIEVEIAEREPQRRWTAWLRLPLLVPPLVLSVVVVGPGALIAIPAAFTIVGLAWLFSFVAGALTFAAWVTAIFRPAPSHGVAELLTWALGYGAQVYGYAMLVTDRYPDAGLALEPPAGRASEHAIRATLEDDGSRSRLVAFFRFQLLAPHVAWLFLWGVLLIPVSFASWLILLFAGRPWRPLYRFAAAYVRYWAHVSAFSWFATRPFPGFTGELGRYPFELTTGEAHPQHRARTLFRLVLAIPAGVLWYLLTNALALVALAAWVAGTIRGRTPSGIRDLAAYGVRYGAQLLAYLLLVTDRYPDSGSAPADVVDPPPDPPSVPPTDWTARPEGVLV